MSLQLDPVVANIALADMQLRTRLSTPTLRLNGNPLFIEPLDNYAPTELLQGIETGAKTSWERDVFALLRKTVITQQNLTNALAALAAQTYPPLQNQLSRSNTVTANMQLERLGSDKYYFAENMPPIEIMQIKRNPAWEIGLQA